MPDMQLTPATYALIDQLSNESRDQALDYLTLPMMTAAMAAGAPIRWCLSTHNQSSWMTIDVDANSNVSIAFKTIPRSGGPAVDADPASVQFARPLPKGPDTLAETSFRRMHAAIGNLAFAALGAGRRNDMDQLQAMLKMLSDHMPWVDHMTALAHRMHGSAAAPHLFKAMCSVTYLGELVDEDLAQSVASPFTTVQALLAIHATQHTTQEPALYALNHPTKEPLYMFAFPEVLDEQNRMQQAGAYMLLDTTGTPIFMNTITPTAHARFCDMFEHSDPELENVRWSRFVPKPNPPVARYQRATDYFDYVQKGYTPATKDFVQRLTDSLPQRLDNDQVLKVVAAWAASPSSTEALWRGNDGKDTLLFSMMNKDEFNTFLAMWSHWATAQWGGEHPKDHAVLQTLLPEMNSLASIDTWRHHLAAAAPGQTPMEMYPLILDDPTP